MKSIRKHIKKISLVMGLSILFTSCTQYDEMNSNNDDNSSQVSYKKNKLYSGEELFKGLFFAKGQVADGLDNIKNSYSYYLVNDLNQAQTSQYEDEIDKVIVEINQKYPYFFNSFKTKIESGLHLEITETIEDGAKKLFEAYVDKFVNASDQNKFVNALKKVDMDNYIDLLTGDIDYGQLHDDLENDPEFQTYFVSPLFVGVVFVAAAYVFVVHAAAAMTYVYAAWVAHSYAAVTKAKTISKVISKKSVSQELLINEISNKLVK